MRLCLVNPHSEDVEVRDTFEQIQADVGSRRKYVTIAEDENGYVLMFDPTENSYVLDLPRWGARATDIRHPW